MEVNTVPAQGIIAAGGLVKHALERWGLLTSMRLITSSKTDRSDIDKNRKAEALENHALTYWEEEIKEYVK